MRRPLRNIEIFSMSVLDMFASALGAFIMIAVILFPFFNQNQQLEHIKTESKGVRVQVQKVKEIVKNRQEIIQAQKKEIQEGTKAKSLLDNCQDSIARCKAALTQTFLIVVIEWDERADVDLHVVDPRNNRYYYGQRSFSGSQAQLSLDMTDGPGIEVWQNPSARPGLYRVIYDLFATRVADSPVSVRGWIVDRATGRRPLPLVDLTPTTGKMRPIVDLRVSSDGSTQMQPSN
jgi:hypothetical protein